MEEVRIGERIMGGGVNEDRGGERKVGAGVEKRENEVSDGKRGGLWGKGDVVTEGVVGFSGGAVAISGIN